MRVIGTDYLARTVFLSEDGFVHQPGFFPRHTEGETQMADQGSTKTIPQAGKRKPKVYVAGPMRGYPDFNFPAFNAAAQELEALGYEVGNPAAWDDPQEVGDNPTGDMEEAVQKGFSLRDALARDTQFIAKQADFIYMLIGWEKSRGAMAEHALAVALDLGIMYQMSMTETPKAKELG